MRNGMWDHMGGWGMGAGMVLWSVVGIALLMVVVAAIVRLLSPHGRQFTSSMPDEADPALTILAERYAKGEIDRDEYMRRRQTLESTKRRR